MTMDCPLCGTAHTAVNTGTDDAPHPEAECGGCGILADLPAWEKLHAIASERDAAIAENAAVEQMTADIRSLAHERDEARAKLNDAFAMVSMAIDCDSECDFEGLASVISERVDEAERDRAKAIAERDALQEGVKDLAESWRNGSVHRSKAIILADCAKKLCYLINPEGET